LHTGPASEHVMPAPSGLAPPLLFFPILILFHPPEVFRPVLCLLGGLRWPPAYLNYFFFLSLELLVFDSAPRVTPPFISLFGDLPPFRPLLFVAFSPESRRVALMFFFFFFPCCLLSCRTTFATLLSVPLHFRLRDHALFYFSFIFFICLFL